MAHGSPAAPMVMAGNLSASASAGLLSQEVNGCGIPASAGLLLVSSPGAGRRIITAAGSLTLPAAAGSIHPLAFSGTADSATVDMVMAVTVATPENQFTLSIHLNLFIEHPPPFLSAKMGNSESCP